MSKEWWWADSNGVDHGPFPQDEIIAGLRRGTIPRDANLWSAGFAEWVPAHKIMDIPKTNARTRGRMAAAGAVVGLLAVFATFLLTRPPAIGDRSAGEAADRLIANEWLAGESVSIVVPDPFRFEQSSSEVSIVDTDTNAEVGWVATFLTREAIDASRDGFDGPFAVVECGRTIMGARVSGEGPSADDVEAATRAAGIAAGYCS